MTNVFIDGSAGTTGLRIADRLSDRQDIQLIRLPEEKRKDPAARKDAINSADIVFLCLPDAAAIEAVTLVTNPNTRIIDASTAHRTNPDWDYGFPELSEAHREVIRLSCFCGESYESIAAILGIELGTVKSRINRAKKELRKILERRNYF